MKDLQDFLKSAGITPNKSLGQNFLRDPRVLADILDGADIDGRAVLEIGPGLGTLTEGLLARAKRVVAVEIDGNMLAALKARLGEPENLTLLHQDFLKVDLCALHADLGGGEFDVVANLPYYATTPICTRLFTCALPIRAMTLMVQKEAARRFFARPGERVYGPMSVLCEHSYTARTLLSVPPHCFYPQPKVDSVVVRLERKPHPLPEGLPRLLDVCFAMRRKTLANNLKAAGIQDAEQILRDSGIPPAARAEALDTEAFLRLLERVRGRL